MLPRMMSTSMSFGRNGDKADIIGSLSSSKKDQVLHAGQQLRS